MRLRTFASLPAFIPFCLAFISIGCEPLPSATNPPSATYKESNEERDAIALCSGEDPVPFYSHFLSFGLEDHAESRTWSAHFVPPKAGIIFVSGVDGGFTEPVDGIYGRIAEKASHLGVPSIFVKYRKPGELEPSVQDALAAAHYLRSLGVSRMAILGWSFGGAVITHTTTRVPEVVTVVGFAPQARDTEPITQFTKQSVLLIHSREDENVPFESSEQILNDAPSQIRTRLVAVDGFDHFLSGAESLLDMLVFEWLISELGL